MKCRDARELLNSYLDNGLDPHNDKLLMDHFEKCSSCREELEFLLEYRKTVKEIKPVKAPAGFMEELRIRLEKEKKSPIRTLFHKTADIWHNFTFPIEAIGVAAVALLIFFLYTPLFHGTKKISTFNEEQVATDIRPKSINEQINEKRKLLPPAADKKDQRERLSFSSDKDVPGMDKTAEGTTVAEEKNPAVLMDSETVPEKESSDDSIFDNIAGNKGAEGVNRSESARKDEAPREFNKKSVTGNEVRRHSAETPEIIIAEYNGVIINKDAGKYTVRIEESRLKGLAEKLRRNYSATYRITGSSGSTVTVEFIIY